MKRIILICIAFLFIASVNAQVKIEKHLDFTGKESVVLNIQISDSIKVQTWNKNEVYANATISINGNKDNDAYEVLYNETGNTVIVNAGFKKDYFKNRENCCIESDISWQIFVPEKASLSIESINADITITGETGPTDVKSISGFIDLSVPQRRPADLDFSTISGTVYSNLLMITGTHRDGMFSHIKDKLNNGGGLIRLETISGDIFFRKSE
jgi:hypothetical protein